MANTKKCSKHRKIKVEMLKYIDQRPYLIHCCVSCYEEKVYKEALIQYERKLREYKSSFLSRLMDTSQKKTSQWEIKQSVSARVKHHFTPGIKEFKQKLRQEYYKSAPSDFDVIIKLSGVEFEEYIESLFQKQGYEVKTTPASGDGGVDLVISKKVDGRVVRTAVQCKRYTKSVGVSAIQEVFTGKHVYKCKNAMVIITSGFTNQAIKTAEQLKVILWDKYKLIEEINRTLKSTNNNTLSWDDYLSRHTLDDEFPV